MHTPGTSLQATVSCVRHYLVELKAADGIDLILLGPDASPDGPDKMNDLYHVGQCIEVTVLLFCLEHGLQGHSEID